MCQSASKHLSRKHCMCSTAWGLGESEEVRKDVLLSKLQASRRWVIDPKAADPEGPTWYPARCLRLREGEYRITHKSLVSALGCPIPMSSQGNGSVWPVYIAQYMGSWGGRGYYEGDVIQHGTSGVICCEQFALIFQGRWNIKNSLRSSYTTRAKTGTWCTQCKN